jgi:DNA-binding PadR family transcriptional regulator
MNDEPAEQKVIRATHPRIQRRRELADSVHLPPELGAKFTESEMAVLKVIADKHVQQGACTLAKNEIAELSCTSHTSVKTTLRAAEAAGLIKVEQGRGRHNTNTNTISPKWKAWLDRYCDIPPDGQRGP